MMNRKILLPLLLTLLIVLLVILGNSLVQKQTQKSSIPERATSLFRTPTPTGEPIPKMNLKDSTIKNIRTSTSASASAITQYMDQATQEENDVIAYRYFVAAYLEMDKEFKQTNDVQIKLAMIQLQSYVSGFPNYKESDFSK